MRKRRKDWKRKMESAPEISVITGVYNPNEKSFYKAVRSVINQSFINWEMIIVDDGSEKRAKSFIADAEKADGRIRVISENKNHGLAYGLNRCIRESKGKYLARMDADDLSAPDRFQKQYDFLENNKNYQWVGSDCVFFDRRGPWGYEKTKAKPAEADFLFNSPFVHPSVMFRKEAVTENGWYNVSEKYKGVEDYELFMRLYASGLKGFNINEPLLFYREDLNSVKRRGGKRRIREAFLRLHGFKSLNVLKPYTFPFVLKPLAVGLLPDAVYIKLRRKSKKFNF